MQNSHQGNNNWDLIIKPDSNWFDLQLKELWRYRGLIVLLVRRDFIAFYQQTILGPLWYLLQPLLTTIVFTVVFGKLARIPTDGMEPFLFFMCGVVCWNYFASCFQQTSGTFIKNAGVFGTIYFPRLTIPISTLFVNLIQFVIQIGLFLGFYAYFVSKGIDVMSNAWLLSLPLLIIHMAILGLGCGLLFSALSSKYRDLTFVMGFFVQLWMFLTPVVYPASMIPEKYLHIYMLNPMASIIELFRFAFLGRGMIELNFIAISWGTSLVILFLGVFLFSKVEKTFMDTI